MLEADSQRSVMKARRLMALRSPIATPQAISRARAASFSQAVGDRPYSTNLTTAVCTKALERGPDRECRSGSFTTDAAGRACGVMSVSL
jgi:hypothetical protein